MTHVALAIAGSETTGGAGAQTDLKTFHQLDTFGCAALTCIVSMDPKDNWNHRFVPVEPQVIADQIEACTGVHDIDTVKIGMLGSPATIDVVAAALAEHSFTNVVLDPVLICKGQEFGHALDTDNALKEKILPKATFVTPNHFEALALSGMDAIESVEDLTEAARRIHDAYDVVVLAKGGVVLEGADAVDVFYDGQQTVELRSPKTGEDRIHGAGCTLAAAVTAELAKGATPLEAARTAKAVVDSSIEHRQPSHLPFDAVYQRGYQG
ncbi:hydroxymethylpyrimidine/phosphomethylpyrimidine kinase [Brachybacterium sp. p3-SID1565]|uniref:hydroxymethylpyrimidine/phosphomethylpyrimidine kinase n=1 Tax=unclassified Brachybacterium TaxID=2623841 RepID=UPI0021AA6F0B|nr:MULTISPECIES: hydroxymethylpyrimidine/phosphomethylpyrimidine kinase [unclassified Brachybacterium]MCT1385396.1 hydroxymethylpyrimidine/phosphomethylpyrimidine kinase [Brachybacterium sp. p3-SID1565]MCT1776681.1 hydroxymethylpyrimidine/phosphomethylpyrimidine kinase [Brachybacterium sp. p3-SID957]